MVPQVMGSGALVPTGESYENCASSVPTLSLTVTGTV
jgi:hypothetical protein